MTYTERHTIRFDKFAKRSLRDDVITGNFTALFTSLLTKSMKVRGWNVEESANVGDTFYTRVESDMEGFSYLYHAHAVITFTRDDGKTPNPEELPAFIRTLYTRAGQPAFGSWTLASVDNENYDPESDDVSSNINSDMIGYVDVAIPEDWEDNFKHLYGRDSHIKRIRGAIEAGIMSSFTNRFHVALVGPPGCAKSDICRSLQRALGEDAVMEYDATATTAAGAIKDLSEREILPRILIVEEIEKADEKALAFLLGLMDLRGEIRKTTARTTIQRDTKMLVIATVNNYDLFKKLNAGALASRFANKVGFDRPSREQLAMILTREVTKIHGDHEWIGPALDYCQDHNITDPRQVISLCLCGREGLLDGTYQKMLEDTAIDEAELQ